MNAEIISVGTELLLGEIVNSDAQAISQGLSELGINVFYHTVVGDNPERLKAAVRIARDRADIIITTGGLGPTCDDLTKKTIAAELGLPLEIDNKSLEKITGVFKKNGRDMTENNVRQAELPKGSVVLDNEWGMAPGCVVRSGGLHLIMLPGPPRECVPMFREKAMPYLASLSEGVIVSHRVNMFNIGEAKMESMLSDLMENLKNPTVAPYAKEGECLTRITAKAPSAAEAEALLKPVLSEVLLRMGSYVYGVDVPSLEDVVVRGLTAKGLTLATAESCTGGFLSKRITDIPGTSSCFLGGVCTYTNTSKSKLLGVPEKLLEAHGAVSAEVAAAMAAGVRACLGADVGIGITGVAGPSGGSADKPVGLVYVALSFNGKSFVRESRWGADRDRVRRMAASHGLDLLRLHVL